MNKGVLTITVGILLAAVSLLADSLGIGQGGMGPRQIAGVVAGAVVAIVGAVMRSKSGKASGAA